MCLAVSRTATMAPLSSRACRIVVVVANPPPPHLVNGHGARDGVCQKSHRPEIRWLLGATAVYVKQSHAATATAMGVGFPFALLVIIDIIGEHRKVH